MNDTSTNNGPADVAESEWAVGVILKKEHEIKPCCYSRMKINDRGDELPR